MRASFMFSNRANVQQGTKGISRFMSDSNEGLCSIECMILDVKAPRVDTDSDHAECVLTRKSTTGAHPVHGVNILQAGSWTQGTRILVEAKRMMMFDFGKDVAQCVVVTDSSLIKSAVERRALWLQERVDPGCICVENWRGEYNIVDRATNAVSVAVLRRHLETLKRSGARDVIS